ncbi:hypothetical protein BB559_006448 [Furculomyces boomerangus]|uniref:Thioredoxin domain-containing protein n=1 Tax=Furculomyces boomerangus TaxID=61424 RepID=A0A2T9Y2V2_9FUNG|nr:hypothetical protein BB559_006448 [Furculomyces boomerangus]
MKGFLPLSILYLVLLLSIFVKIEGKDESKKLIKLRKLVAADADGIADFAAKDFFELANPGNDYSLVVMLTANDPEYQCVHCQNLEPEYAAVARYAKKHKLDSKLFFAKAEPAKAMEVFQRLRVANPPRMFMFLSKDGKSDKEYFEITLENISKAEQIANELSKATSQKIGVIRKFDYSKIKNGLFTASLVIISVLSLYKIGMDFKKFINNIVAATIMVFVLSMNSGYMWNTIKNPPLMSPRSQNKYFSTSTQEQLGIETIIMSCCYGFCAVLMVFLIKRIPTFPNMFSATLSAFTELRVLITLTKSFFSFLLKTSTYIIDNEIGLDVCNSSYLVFSKLEYNFEEK